MRHFNCIPLLQICCSFWLISCTPKRLTYIYFLTTSGAPHRNEDRSPGSGSSKRAGLFSFYGKNWRFWAVEENQQEAILRDENSTLFAGKMDGTGNADSSKIHYGFRHVSITLLNNSVNWTNVACEHAREHVYMVCDVIKALFRLQFI